jgi:hypothetical protein
MKLQNELADPTVSQGLSNFESVLHQVKMSRQTARYSIRRQISSGLWEDLCPEGTLEEVLVEKLAVNLWRQRRSLITKLAAKDCGTAAVYWLNVPEMDLRLRYASSLYRDVDRTLNQLERLQRMRTGQPVPPTITVEVSQ